MATKKEIEEHLQIALKEIGEIKPWYDRSLKCWLFSHELYPVEYGGDSKEEVIQNYPLYMREFILHRLKDKIAENVEKRTKGKGGKREGAGRPFGTKKEHKMRISLPDDIALYLKNISADQIRKKLCL